MQCDYRAWDRRAQEFIKCYLRAERQVEIVGGRGTYLLVRYRCKYHARRDYQHYGQARCAVFSLITDKLMKQGG